MMYFTGDPYEKSPERIAHMDQMIVKYPMNQCTNLTNLTKRKCVRERPGINRKMKMTTTVQIPEPQENPLR
jgi:hypothetical protein